MALGPRIDLRQSQSLVMTPQLQQAIKLLALSNVEIEAFIAEELAKNPLLEATSSDDEGEAAPPEGAPAPAGDGDEAPDPAGSDELIASLGGSEDEPLDHDWREAALDTDSLSDLGGGSGSSDEAFDFDRLSANETSLTEHLLEQLHGVSGPEGMLAVAIVQELEETGYLTTPLDELPRRWARRGPRPSRRWPRSRNSIRRASRRAILPNASRSRPRRPTATTRRWRG